MHLPRKSCGGSSVIDLLCIALGILRTLILCFDFSPYLHRLSTSESSTVLFPAAVIPLTSSSCAVLRVLDLVIQLLPPVIAAGDSRIKLVRVPSHKSPVFSVLRVYAICDRCKIVTAAVALLSALAVGACIVRSDSP